MAQMNSKYNTPEQKKLARFIYRRQHEMKKLRAKYLACDLEVIEAKNQLRLLGISYEE